MYIHVHLDIIFIFPAYKEHAQMYVENLKMVFEFFGESK